MKPILFGTPMVQAILKGSKTKTRRMKGLEFVNKSPDEYTSVGIFNGEGNSLLTGFRTKQNPLTVATAIDVPYGPVGSMLWVRETWAPKRGGGYCYKADQSDCPDRIGQWRPSIHMPMHACRLILKVKNYRIERLQDISETDAIAEGIEQLDPWPEAADRKRFKLYYPDALNGLGENATFNPIFSFYTLWCSINGDDAVKQNPWVWVVDFESQTTSGLCKPSK